MTTDFKPVAVYDFDGNFLGYAVKRDGVDKLHSMNLWNDQDIQAQLERLNADVDLRQHWPHPKDPEVLALLDDETFEPIAYKDVQVVDDEQSRYVYKQIPRTGIERAQLGSGLVDSDEIDEEASTIVYKTVMVPERPTDVMWRIKKACEQVARERANLLSS